MLPVSASVYCRHSQLQFIARRYRIMHFFNCIPMHADIIIFDSNIEIRDMSSNFLQPMLNFRRFSTALSMRQMVIPVIAVLHVTVVMYSTVLRRRSAISDLQPKTIFAWHIMYNVIIVDDTYPCI